jgi:hypothetical protein
METIFKQFKHILTIAMLLLTLVPAIAQVIPASTAPVNSQTKQAATSSKKPPQLSDQRKDFYHLAAQANVMFVYPKGFKEILAPNDEDFSFDYALELPGKEFEIWIQLKSEKENWKSYLNNQAHTANPDSAYVELGKAMAMTFTGDDKYFERNIPSDILARYNADAGKSYLLTLLDLPDCKHYKYALLITLQKNHTGSIMAVCFTNDKSPEFFKNINKASNCMKFKP